MVFHRDNVRASQDVTHCSFVYVCVTEDRDMEQSDDALF